MVILPIDLSQGVESNTGNEVAWKVTDLGVAKNVSPPLKVGELTVKSLTYK